MYMLKNLRGNVLFIYYTVSLYFTNNYVNTTLIINIENIIFYKKI